MGEFVECGDSSPQGSESGDKLPHSTFYGLNDDQDLCRQGLAAPYGQFQISRIIGREFLGTGQG